MQYEMYSPLPNKYRETEGSKGTLVLNFGIKDEHKKLKKEFFICNIINISKGSISALTFYFAKNIKIFPKPLDKHIFMLYNRYSECRRGKKK